MRGRLVEEGKPSFRVIMGSNSKDALLSDPPNAAIHQRRLQANLITCGKEFDWLDSRYRLGSQRSENETQVHV